MSEIATTVVTASSIMTAVMGGVVYFIKRNFELIMDKKIQQQNMLIEKEMSIFNMQLENKSKEQFLVFESLHRERAELIRSLFKHLVSVKRKLEGLLMAEMDKLVPIDEVESFKDNHFELDDSTLQRWWDEYIQEILAMMGTHEENSYYLSVSLSGKFEEFVGKLNIINTKYGELRDSSDRRDLKEYLQELRNILNESKALFQPIIKDIENEFRTLIGANG